VPVVTVNPGFNEFRDVRIDSLFSATLQAGIAWNNWLSYVKGGWAGANEKIQNSLTGGTACVGATLFPSCGGTSRRPDGWTVGAGLEHGLTPNLSIGAEANYYALKADNVAVTSSTGLVSTFGNIRNEIWTVTGRINWHFGNPGAVF
jgi:outer membrane immunogenic protein